MSTRLLACLLPLALLGACAAPGDSPAEQRAAIDEMAALTLAELYESEPGSEERVRDSEGYAVFNNKQVSVFLLGGGGGYGLAHDQQSGETTYMRMGEGAVGIGLGIKDFRAVFVFDDRELFDQFLVDGWDVGAEADAAAMADGEGGEASAEGSFRPGVSVYQFTETGLALRANIAGTKYWPYTDLNE